MVGSIFLDRGDREKAYASLEAAANRIQTEKLQALIAPEGTRSKDGTMGRFKLGAFHLAHAAQASILPVVMHGNAAVWPVGQFAPSRGDVVIDVMPEFELEDASSNALRAVADGLRARYLEAIAAGPILTPPP
jgi:putative phosphoserine phosphatase/1-acylglycerol-3-phosphate O-acyltransferase